MKTRTALAAILREGDGQPGFDVPPNATVDGPEAERSEVELAGAICDDISQAIDAMNTPDHVNPDIKERGLEALTRALANAQQILTMHGQPHPGIDAEGTEDWSLEDEEDEDAEGTKDWSPLRY